MTTTASSTTPPPNNNHNTDDDNISRSSMTSFFAEIRRMSSDDDHDLREEARHQPSIFDSVAPDFYSPPPLTHHVDYHSKTERRKKELEVLRTKQLAKPKAARLQTAQPPKDTLMDFFEERQRRWTQEDRMGRSAALETLHKFQANDKEVIYLGSPERTKIRRPDQTPGTPDATASVYHSPHHLVVVLQDGDTTQRQWHDESTSTTTTTTIRTYSHHQESSSSAPLPSSSSSSPDSSKIPMSSLMKVARTLLMKNEEEEEEDNTPITSVNNKLPTDVTLADYLDDSPIVHDASSYPLGSLTMSSIEPAIQPTEARDDIVKPESSDMESSVAKIPMNEIASMARSATMALSSNKTTFMAADVEFSIVKAPNEVVESLSIFESVAQQLLPPNSELEPSSPNGGTTLLPISTSQNEAKLTQSDHIRYSNDQPAINKTSSYELKSFESFGTAILPMTNGGSYDEMGHRSLKEEYLGPVILPLTTSRDDKEEQPLLKPPARKVSEGSSLEFDRDCSPCINSQDDQDLAIIGPYDDMLQSFASFGVAILPTVSRSRDEEDDDEKEETTTTKCLDETEPTLSMRPTVDVFSLKDDIETRVLQQTMESDDGFCKEPTGCFDHSSIFRPLISPSIQCRVDELASKASFLGPVALPSTGSMQFSQAKEFATTPLCDINVDVTAESFVDETRGEQPAEGNVESSILVATDIEDSSVPVATAIEVPQGNGEKKKKKDDRREFGFISFFATPSGSRYAHYL